LKENDLDWIYGETNVVEENKKSIGIWPKHWYEHWGYKNFIGRYSLKFFNFVPHQGVFMKKSVFENFGNFDESLPIAMDVEYWLRVRSSTKWGFLNRIVANYRRSPYSQSSKLENMETTRLCIDKIRRKYLNSVERKIASLIEEALWFKSKRVLS
jgi:hypothetical protein